MVAKSRPRKDPHGWEAASRPVPVPGISPNSPLRELGYWTVPEAADVLGISTRSVYARMDSGAMESILYNGRRVVPTSAIRSCFADFQRDTATRDAALERMQRHAEALGITFRHPDEVPDRDQGEAHG